MKNKELEIDGTTLILAPLSITSINAQQIKEDLITKLINCTKITVDLKETEEFDIAGLQIIKGLQNHCILNGLEFSIFNISEIVKTKLNMMEVTL